MPELENHPEEPLDDAFRELLDHNERVRAERRRALRRGPGRLVVPAGIVLLVAGAGTAAWATGALDDQVSTAGNTGVYIDRTPAVGLTQTHHTTTARTRTTAPATTAASTTTAETATTTASTPEETTTAAPQSTTLASANAEPDGTHLALTIPDEAAGPTSLTIQATRGDSWVEVRLGSSTGRLLQVGTMNKGSSSTVQGSRLWVRFGNVGNLDLLVNGKPVHPSHLGTITVIVTPSGLKG